MANDRTAKHPERGLEWWAGVLVVSSTGLATCLLDLGLVDLFLATCQLVLSTRSVLVDRRWNEAASHDAASIKAPLLIAAKGSLKGSL